MFASLKRLLIPPQEQKVRGKNQTRTDSENARHVTGFVCQIWVKSGPKLPAVCCLYAVSSHYIPNYAKDKHKPISYIYTKDVRDERKQ